jgi:hypothetical protein
MTTSNGHGDKSSSPPSPPPRPAELATCRTAETFEQFGQWLDAQLAVLERQQERFVRTRTRAERAGR